MCTGCTNLIEFNIIPHPDKVSIVNTEDINCAGMFDWCSKMTIAPKFTWVSNLGYMFQHCSSITRIEGADNQWGDWGRNGRDRAFYNCTALETIEPVIAYGSGWEPFYNCVSLKDIHIKNLGGGNVDLHWSPLLSTESIIYMLTNAQSNTTTYSLKFHEDIKTKFDNNEIDTNLVTEFINKGWTIYFGDTQYNP